MKKEINTNYNITVTGRGDAVHIECGVKENLLEAMIRQGIFVSASCGGRGTCGKCRLQLIKGKLDISTFDRAVFSEGELKEGYRLSCKAIPKSDCTIKLTTGDEADFEVITDCQKTAKAKSIIAEDCAIAIDIGTTTIVVTLIELSSGNALWTYSTVNKQRVYGADVITRIQASNAGKKDALRESIQKDLLVGIRTVIGKTGIIKEKIKKVTIAGNTTMGHLLLGYSCETLGFYPFIPVNIKETILSFEEVMGCDELEVPVVLLPGISTYVGGDIVAGLLSCNFDITQAPCLLIDLGTNGEMAIGNKDKIIVTSTAAGPAFEGGNISCGVGSIAGAICNIDIEEKLNYRTIGDKTPIGICGTGVIELVFELIKAGLVDDTGLLEETYFEDGYTVATDETGKRITFTQRDIREIQLAKAAVRAGIELLIRRYEISYEDIDTVYLAGGFGYKVNIEKAVGIGLLPKELTGKIKAIGNSSLGGAIKYLLEDKAVDRMKHIIGVTSEINLSNDKDFNELYINQMYFE
ncbi:MAG: ASKHA domain-containing protein, partial [Herbinix sp.]|nr:ASKHA domain-containing protein [Herbinix sp.]